MLHYFAAKFFAPVLVSPYFDGDDLNVYVVTDELHVREVRDPVTHTLSFMAKTNPRPFRFYKLLAFFTSIHISTVCLTSLAYVRNICVGTFLLEHMCILSSHEPYVCYMCLYPHIGRM